MNEAIIKKIAVAFEISGAQLSEMAMEAVIKILSEYEDNKVLKSLEKCMKSVRGRITLADIVKNIDDGFPSADEAWALIPKSENETVCWTNEVSQAYTIIAPLMSESNMNSARMAFRDAYNRLVDDARYGKKEAVWSVSLGQNEAGREPVIRKALREGKITESKARLLLPAQSFQDGNDKLISGSSETTQKRLTSGECKEIKADQKDVLENLDKLVKAVF